MLRDSLSLVPCAVTLSLFLVVGAVGLRVEDAQNVSKKDLEGISKGLESALERRSGAAVTVDRASEHPCRGPDRCVGELRRRTSSTDIVFVRLIGVPTRIRLLAERVPTAGAGHEAEVDLPRSAAGWTPIFEQVAAALFPEPMPPPPAHVATVPRLPDAVVETPPVSTPGPEAASGESARWIAFAGLGLSAAALGAGIGFGLSSRSARTEAAEAPHSAAELDDLEGRAIGHGWAANVLFGVALTGLVTGAVALALD